MQPFDTRTQYDVVTWGCTVSVLDVPPPAGCDVFPLCPMYHWNCSGASPVAPTESVTCALPSALDCGCSVIDGGVHAGVWATPYTASIASRSQPCRFAPYGSLLNATPEFMIAAVVLVPPGGGSSE